MIAWLFKDGEALPTGPNARRMRMAMLASALASRGDDVHCFASTFIHVGKRLHSTSDVVLPVDPGYKLHLLHAGSFSRNLSFKRYLFHRRYAYRVRSYCGALPRPDIILCAFPLIDVAAWAVEYGRRHGIPVIVDVRDLWPDVILGIFPDPVRPLARVALDRDFRLTRNAFRNATAVTSISHGVLRWALAKVPRHTGDRDRVFPIGYPVRKAAAEPDPAVEQWLAPLRDRRIFAYVGTLAKSSNINVMLDAARVLAAQDPTVHFVIAGDGPDRDRIQAVAATLPNVTAPGWLTQPAVRQVEAAAFAGVLPLNTLPDAMPNKFFEYISAGLPVLSSATGELNDLISHERVGMPFSATNPQSLVDAIRRLCADPDLTAGMASRAAALFEARFREDLVYGAFADYLHDVARAS
jgi:glycosyltransferase involved in cell wall biosynthesis